MSKYLPILAALALTACAAKPEPEKTVYLPQHLDALPVIQVSDIVNYSEAEIPVIATGRYRPARTGIVLPEFAEKDPAIRHIYFETGRADITPSGAAEVSGSLPHDLKRVHLRGYADPRGSQIDNLRLSQERVQAAKQYMQGKGAKVSQTEFFGEDALPEQ
ncbi:MAG: OmpA family protein [Neisseriaceae bacterium]|nr:OmpA family protein [Neisseriaceae bacterium]